MPRATSPSRAALAALRLVQNNTLCALRRRKVRILRRLGRARAPDNGTRKFTRSGFPRAPSLYQRCPGAGLVGTSLFVAGPRNGYSLDAGRLEVVEGVLAAQGVDLQGRRKKKGTTVRPRPRRPTTRPLLVVAAPSPLVGST
jgi:hypothetical protein